MMKCKISFSPVRDTVVVNDRWGIDTQCRHGDFFNCHDQYNPGVLQKHKWENAMTVDTGSWGFRRQMNINEVRSIHELITILAETISCGGNLLMNVGPTGDGRIDPVFQERLIQMGNWLRVNGDAVYSSKPWIFQNDTLTAGIWYTSKLRNSAGLDPRRLFNPQQKDNTIAYVFVLSWPPSGKLRLDAPRPTEQTKASMLGLEGSTLPYQPNGQKGMILDLTSIPFNKMPSYDAWVIKLEYLGDDSRNPLAA